MYPLAGIDFSDRLGIVVSELAPEEMDLSLANWHLRMDRQEHTLDAKPGSTRELELAVFAAA
jgi:hypothetical protein